jgi:hypothetical protein
MDSTGKIWIGRRKSSNRTDWIYQVEADEVFSLSMWLLWNRYILVNWKKVQKLFRRRRKDRHGT